MEDESIHLTLFSPPYDEIRDYTDGNKFDSNKLSSSLYKKTIDGGVVVVIIGDQAKDFKKSLTSFRLCLDWCDKFKWNLFECCIYERHGRPGAAWSSRFRLDHEYILIFYKGQRPRSFSKKHMYIKTKYAGLKFHGSERQKDGSLVTMNKPSFVPDTKCKGTVWKYSPSSSEVGNIKLQHPATFPDALARDIIKTFTNKGDIVLDPTCGSGTTCVMSIREDRKYLGFDISEEYIKLAKERIKIEEEQIKLF